ncbi:hypothetical protein AHAS_Ahas02G0105700 [Arachis hypogaea]
MFLKNVLSICSYGLGQPGLQNVIKATKIYFNPDLAEVIDFRKRMRLLLFLVLSLMLLKRVVSSIPLAFVERQFNQNIRDNYPIIFKTLEGKKIIVHQAFRDSNHNEILSDDIGSLLQSDVEETQDLLSHLLDDSTKIDVSNICNDSVLSKLK